MSVVLVDKPEAQVSVISLNRPERLNAMSIDLCLALDDALEPVGRIHWMLRLLDAAGAIRGFTR